MERREFFRAAFCSVLAVSLPRSLTVSAEVSEIEFTNYGPDGPDGLYTMGWKITVDGKKYGDFIVLKEPPTESDTAVLTELLRDQAERSIAEIGRLA